MAEELDVQGTEVQEELPLSEQVPKEAIFEPARTIGEAMEMELPEPEPEQAPEPEQPDLPVVEPDWLNEPPPQPRQQYPPENYQPTYDYPMMQPQPTQAQPRTAGDAALESFVENPTAWLESQLAAREQQTFGPIQQQLQSIAFMQQHMMENSVREAKGRADAAIRNAYSQFNKDASFRSNKQMQDAVKGTLEGMRQRAEYEARVNGNWGPMNTLINMDQSEIAGTLGYLRAKYGTGSPGTAPLQVEGATVESSRAAVADKDVVLSEEQREVARRLGPAYERKLKKAVAEQQKYDDLEWS